MAKLNQLEKAPARPAEWRLQTFSFAAPGATSVQLMGDFTRWEFQPINMQKCADGVWRASVQLHPGTHRYRFLVDGRSWHEDPACILRVPNPYGGHDTIRRVL